MPKKRTAPAKSDLVSLRLVQNAFVYGEFCPQGTIMQFTPTEAKKRLSSTQYWETV